MTSSIVSTLAYLLAVPSLARLTLPRHVRSAWVAFFILLLRRLVERLLSQQLQERITRYLQLPSAPTTTTSGAINTSEEQPSSAKAKPELVPDLTPKPVSVSMAEMTEILLPSQADTHGVAYSGMLMSLIDIVAGIAAKSHTSRPCVTASVDAVHFLKPILVGDVIVLKSSVNRVWRSSMEVGVIVEAENMSTGERRYCCHAYLTFVALHEGKACHVPPVLPETGAEKIRFDEAEQRRADRLEMKQKQTTTRQLVSSSPVTPMHNAAFREASGNTAVVDPSAAGRLSSASYTQNVHLIMPQHANSLGVTFGGHIIELMEATAVVAASRHAHGLAATGKTRTGMVFRTVSLDSLNFLNPTRIGDMVNIRAYVSRSWKTSMEVYVTVHSRSPHGSAWKSDETSSTDEDKKREGTGGWSFTNDGYMTLIVVDASDTKNATATSENVGSLTLPEVITMTEVERWRYECAAERRQRRLEGRRRVVQHRRASSQG